MDALSNQDVRLWSRLGAVAIVGLVLVIGLMGWARPADRGSIEPTATGLRVMVNTAGRDELRLLPGVGATVADYIVEHRERHGPFTRPVELESVHRIGEKTRRRMERWMGFEAEAE